MKKCRGVLLSLLLCALLLTGCGSAGAQLSAAPTPEVTASPTPTPTPSPTATPTPTPRPTDCVREDGTIDIYIYGEPERADTSGSSWIDGLRYYPDSCHLVLETDGKEYTFANITPSLWEEFASAPSPGGFYNAHLKGNHDYWVTGYDGTNGECISVHFMG